LKQFTKNSPENIDAILEKFVADGIDSIILDLRDNLGGLLDAAVNIVDEFVEAGTVVYTKGRRQKRRDFSANENGSYLRGRGHVVVLVNGNSASAAEIVSGALQCLGRAVVVGERSYGKGSVQNLMRVMGDEALLKLTTAYYYLQNGRLLHRKLDSRDWGINPGIKVSLSMEKRSTVLRLHNKAGLLKEFDAVVRKKRLEDLYSADLQLQAAVLVLNLQKMKDSLAAGHPAVAGRKEPS